MSYGVSRVSRVHFTMVRKFSVTFYSIYYALISTKGMECHADNALVHSCAVSHNEAYGSKSVES